MKVKWLLLIDLDKTLWDIEDASVLTPPLRSIGPYSAIDTSGKVIKAYDEIVKFLKWAKSKSAIIVALSWNLPEVAVEVLKATGLAEFFDYYAIEFHPRKDMMLQNLITRLWKDGLRGMPNCIIYIDDVKYYLDQVSNVTDSVCGLLAWVDFVDFESLIRAVNMCLIKCGICVCI